MNALRLTERQMSKIADSAQFDIQRLRALINSERSGLRKNLYRSQLENRLSILKRLREISLSQNTSLSPSIKNQ